MKRFIRLGLSIRVVGVTFCVIYFALFFKLSSLTLAGDHHGPQKLQKIPKIASIPTPPLQIRLVDEKKNLRPPTPLPPTFTGTHGIIDGKTSPVFENDKLWKRSSILPEWMKSYLEWHKTQRELLAGNITRLDSTRIYLVECIDEYFHCGGTADRLAPLPFHVAVANATQRILLIRWTKPKPLESFLLPPRGGIDWRVPQWMWQDMQETMLPSSVVATYEDKIWQLSKDERPGIVRVKFQSPNHGATTYNSQVRTREDDPSFEQVSHDLWRVFFTPIPPIAHQIQKQMYRMQLTPGNYAVTHVRALYAVQSRESTILQQWAHNAVRCATNMEPVHSQGVPILFISDSNETAGYAHEFAEENPNLPIRSRLHEVEPLHLEKEDNWQSRPESDYYDTFVDIYLLGMSRCVAYNMGGFGKWGSYLGYNSSCVFHMRSDMVHCDLKQPYSPGSSSQLQERLDEYFFVPPMTSVSRIASDKFDKDEPLPQFLYKQTSHGTHLWSHASILPKWMQRYFWWHQAQMDKLDPTNWKSQSYLIMQCLNTDEKCGGTADRLKPLLTLLRLAAMNDRILLIQWTRPCKLEEFLLPPKGGIDWRVPKWLGPHLETNGIWVVPGEDVQFYAFEKNATILRSRYQSNNGGLAWYNEQLVEGETPFDEIYHAVWKIFFTPSKPLAKAITAEMNKLGLVPNEYTSAHVRAVYAVEFRALKMVENWVKNGINCASELRPGRPIFVASDHKYASKAVQMYSEIRNWPIVTHASDPDPPLHLDKAKNALSRAPSDYYDTFIDLYILALGGCVTFNKGGYGSWGLIIGGNITCKRSWKRTNKGIQEPCNWTTAGSSNGHRPSSPNGHQEPFFLEPMIK